jgi:signal transduction histidine kinase/ActR/RegA family two-component response regulator
MIRYRPIGSASPRLMAIGAALILVIAGIALTAANGEAYRRQQLAQLEVQADIFASGLSAALAFDDREAMREYVEALAANRDIEVAGVYDKGGSRVAAFSRDQTNSPPQVEAVGPPHFEGQHAVVAKPVAVAGGPRLGSIYVRAKVEPVLARMLRYSAIALFAVLAALLVAVVLVWQAALSRANRELDRRASNLAEANAHLNEEMIRREKAERALMQSQRMEAIGQLTGGLAHDFNNLLAALAGGLRLLSRTDDPARRLAIQASMKQAVDKGARLTRQMLAFARGQRLEPSTVDPARNIGAMQELLQRSVGEDVQIEMSFPPDLWYIEVDPGQLELVILNLAVNARDAMPAGGRLTVTASNVTRSETPTGDFARIVLQDTGEGMSQEVIDRAFEPFFTTKDIGRGTGLGLAQVYGFAQQSGGAVWIESQADQGTTVRLDLPRSFRTIERGEPSAETSLAISGHADKPARILVVEDDDTVAAVVEQMIVDFGFACRRAATANAALTTLESEAFDLVFSDVVMPGGMNGVELAREVRRRRPNIPIILTTGYSGKADAESAGFPIFYKPYDPEALLAALNGALRQKAGSGDQSPGMHDPKAVR